MLTGRKKSRFSIIDPLKRRKRICLYVFRNIQAITSLGVLVLFYLVPPEQRDDVVTETCYPAVFMLLVFRVFTSPTAKVSFYYNFYVNTISVGLYSVVGTNDLYLGLVGRPKPFNAYLHYARLDLMLLTCFLIVGDILYTEFFEKNVRLLPEKMSVGDAMRAKIEAAVQKYHEDLAKKNQEEAEKAEGADKVAVDKAAADKAAVKAAEKAASAKARPNVEVLGVPEDQQPSTSSKKPQRWF